MRIAFLLVIALAGCAKKSAPAKSPAVQPIENKAAGDSTGAPGGGAPDDAPDKDETKGDPCDGGENKNKKK